jgi:predicted permease
MRTLIRRLKYRLQRGRLERDLAEEMETHRSLRQARLEASGMPAREAELASRRALGNITLAREDAREIWIWRRVGELARDVRHGIRLLRRSPGFASVAVLSLALGIGGTSAIFSLVDAAILKPLPMSHPDSLVIVEWTNDGFPPGAENINGHFRSIAGGRRQGSSVPANLYRRLAHEQTAFEALVGIADADAVAIAVDASPAEQVSLQYVSGNFFQGLGSLPVLGRPFREDDDRPGQEPVVIVSHRFWMSRLAGAASALDRRVRVNNVPARIAGVAPPGFFGLQAGQWTDVYAPLAMKVAFLPRPTGGAPRAENDRDWWVRQVARLKPGIPEATARVQAAALFRNLVVPDGTREVPELITLPGRRGFNALNARDTSALWILMLLVGVLLLIVCANVANLLLSRSVGRQRESAVRLALGAARMRLFRQHLIESGVLALLGGAAGLALGYALAQSIHVLFQTGRDASSAFDLHLDLRVLGYTGAISILTALSFGVAPAVQAARAELGDTLKAHTRSVIGGRLRLPRLLVSIQIALCLAALVAAGLLGRSLENLKWMDVGFDRENLAYASVSPSRAGYPVERLGPYVDRVREELARLPGVLGVSTVSFRPLSGMGNNGLLNFSGRPLNMTDRANLNGVGEGFFETVGIPLVAGRTIDRRDMRSSAEAVVVDEVFTRQFFPNENPLGRRFGLGPNNNDQYEIVGVVGNSAYNSLRSDAYPTVYEPYIPGGTIHFAVRSTMDSTRLADAVRTAVASVDPAVPLTEFHTQTALIDRLLRTERLLGFMSGAFGAVALTLAAVGLGGLLAYAVARRTNEIGVRMALGAAAGDVTRMVLRESLSMVGAGILIGVPCAYAVARILKTTLFRLEPLDVRTSALSFVVLLAVAVVAAWVPARRAAGIDPMTALREE